MSEPLPDLAGRDVDGPASLDAPRTAGAMLRAAREREGLHLAVLAATIKVTPAKLQALEQDRYDELPNATFARALAQSVCRSLKIDPRPVLALLPQPDAPPLEAAVGRINAPFQERGSRSEGSGFSRISKPMFWAGGLLLLAAVAVAFLPSSLLDSLDPRSSPPSAAPAAAPESQAGTVSEVVATPAAEPAGSEAPGADRASPGSEDATPQAVAQTGPQDEGQAVASASSPAAAEAAASVASVEIRGDAPAATPPPAPEGSAATPQGQVSLRASADSWIEVVDAQDRVVFSRVLHAGETVALDAQPPLRLRIGNAAATTVLMRGEPVDLAPHTRVNVARLELR